MNFDKEKYRKIKIKVEDILVQVVAKVVLFFSAVFHVIKEEFNSSDNKAQDNFDDNQINFSNTFSPNRETKSYSENTSQNMKEKELYSKYNYNYYNHNSESKKEEKQEKDYMDPSEGDYEYYSYDNDFD